MEKKDETESFYRDTIEDMGSENYQLEDPMTFWNAEKKTLWKKILSRSETPFVMMGIGLILVVTVFFAISPEDGGQSTSRETDALSERLQLVENKISAMETQLQGIVSVDQKMELLEKSILRFDSANASASIRMDRIAEDMKSIQNEIEAIKKKTPPAAVATPPASSQSGKSKTMSPALTHQVQKGDTLYSISRRYGLSVAAILKLNGLSGQDAIYPGQKLKVKE